VCECVHSFLQKPTSRVSCGDQCAGSNFLRAGTTRKRLKTGCNMRTPLPNEPTPCIHVLAFDRPASLQLLLNGLNEIEYGDSFGKVWLHISVDRPQRGKNSESQWHLVHQTFALADNFSFAAGRKTVRIRKTHAGLARQWLHSWRPHMDVRDSHRACVLLEDDTMPSRYAWEWTMRALQAYANEAEIASFAWNRPTLVAAHSSSVPTHMPPAGSDENPFLYKLMSTWGFVALRRSWACFLRWSEASMHTSEAVRHNGTLIQPEVWFARKPHGSVWSVHFIRFMEAHGLFTLYPNIRARRTLCANTRAAGLNFARTLGPEFALLRAGDSLRALSSFPSMRNLQSYDWNARLCTHCFGNDVDGSIPSHSCCYSRRPRACSTTQAGMRTQHAIDTSAYALAGPELVGSRFGSIALVALMAMATLLIEMARRRYVRIAVAGRRFSF
jgi:hypothetical protein